MYLHSTLIKYKAQSYITIIYCIIYLHSTLIKYKDKKLDIEVYLKSIYIPL